MVRNPQNTKQHLWYHPIFNDKPVFLKSGPLIEEYLQSLEDVVDAALYQHRRVFAFRFELRCPDTPLIDFDEYLISVMTRFMESFKAQIRHDRMLAKRARRTAADTVVRYVWACERNHAAHPHWHVAILLNGDAYAAIGQYKLGNDNMYNRVIKAWASALKMEVEETIGLVHFPAKPEYELYRDDEASIADFFHRASYLCKAATKRSGIGRHSFGCSRR
ncbi:inovirus Gp2 family protein [Vogesella sp. GCM10023246]|uniref:Inovirus Gp2 family protein n=1 Tax=Vogesella oryzagri TaxID=3160864 RepID=A0ABV1M7D6_9NEIS